MLKRLYGNLGLSNENPDWYIHRQSMKITNKDYTTSQRILYSEFHRYFRRVKTGISSRFTIPVQTENLGNPCNYIDKEKLGKKQNRIWRCKGNYKNVHKQNMILVGFKWTILEEHYISVEGYTDIVLWHVDRW
jgi:hypothetical protein